MFLCCLVVHVWYFVGRKMEAQCGGGGGAGGEMRKIHVIYFLSRKGRTEHPHLIKVHHLSRNGVRLRGM